jgi:hypothetical protein
VNSGHLANPVSQSFIVATGAFAAMDHIIPSYSWDRDEETEQSTKTQMNISYS